MRWQAIAALTDQGRRALYDYVRRQRRPVSRDEAARAVSVSRGLAAFHLDKLTDAGLLHAHYEPAPDKPRGRGRAPKVYQPATAEIAVTIPERHYQLVAEILTDAVATCPEDAHEAATRIAAERGLQAGRTALDHHPEPADARDGLDLACGVLADLGYEPHRARPDRVLLDNCPFHALATRQTQLVCRLNHAYLDGLLRGLDQSAIHATLTPRPPACCVELRADNTPDPAPQTPRSRAGPSSA